MFDPIRYQSTIITIKSRQKPPYQDINRLKKADYGSVTGHMPVPGQGRSHSFPSEIMNDLSMNLPTNQKYAIIPCFYTTGLTHNVHKVSIYSGKQLVLEIPLYC